MKIVVALTLTAFVAALALSGIARAADPKSDDAKIQANLAKLTPEDRKAAEAQKWCAIEEENLLGTMGKPIKVMVKGEPVFVCCKGCVKAAKKNPDETLAKVKELKKKAADNK